ncbi:hypothetical protein [Sinomonas sp. B1-1]|uniref:hypothetical protein n=1 Tax=Sinomonas sp. B1-1 TaxID=3141454 RepID=UPI003D2BBBF9
MPSPRWSRLLSGSHPDSSGHVGSCPDCRGRLETERRYLAALRESEIPRASSTLQERLLEQTRHLAAQADSAEDSGPSRRGRAAARTGLSVLLGAAAATGALAVTAYTVAGEAPGPAPGESTSAAFVRTAKGSPTALPPGPASNAPGEREAAAAPDGARTEDPIERIGRGLRMVFGASWRP